MTVKNRILLYSIIFLSSLITSCEKERFQTASQTDYDKELLAEVNAHRLSVGLAPLVHNDFLWQIANEHTENMANGDVPFGHEGLTKRSDRIRNQLGLGEMAENVATGEGIATVVVKSWLASVGHKINIEENYTMTGLSAVETENGLYYYTQIFFKTNP